MDLGLYEGLFCLGQDTCGMWNIPNWDECKEDLSM